MICLLTVTSLLSPLLSLMALLVSFFIIFCSRCSFLVIFGMVSDLYLFMSNLFSGVTPYLFFNFVIIIFISFIPPYYCSMLRQFFISYEEFSAVTHFISSNLSICCLNDSLFIDFYLDMCLSHSLTFYSLTSFHSEACCL